MEKHINNTDMSDYFPLKTVGDVLKLFEYELSKKEPNLVMLSIVAGEIENSMTNVKPIVKEDSTIDVIPIGVPNAGKQKLGDADLTNTNLPIEPVLYWDLVHALYQKFESIIKSCCDVNLLQAARSNKHLSESERGKDIRALVKHVADIVWNTLSKSQYKDRPHLQSIYSYLTGNKLDCFGVAFAVVAACQLLEINDVHLALSEDHAWVVFGNNGEETAEVTWHGKGSEDKRGQPVEMAKAKMSWLYVAGQPVVCDRYMELAALVNAINPAINATTDSLEVGELQKELLWLLHDQGHLKSFPMAIGNLADLEEISPSLGRPHCTQLYEEAIAINRTIFDNHHVYPYTYQGGYFYRAKKYKEAIESWSNAADVIKLYKYSKDDEEIYKEFMEIANELIPHVMKAEAASNKPMEESVLNDPYCFGQLIRFYDGICCWEEGSPTPVLHIGWAKPMVASFSKFDAGVRNQLKFSGPARSEEDDLNPEELDEGKHSSPSFSNFLSVDTDDNISLPNESFHSASSDEGICLLTPTSIESNKDDKLNFLCVSNEAKNVPENTESKSKKNNLLLDDNVGETAINNNYYDKYSKAKSTSIPCDNTISSMSLNSSFSSSCDNESVKNSKNSTTVIDKNVSKNVLPSDVKSVCDNDVQNRSQNSNHKKRKYFDNTTTNSQESYNNKVQKKYQNNITSISSNICCNLNKRCERNNCDMNPSITLNGQNQYYKNTRTNNLLSVANLHKERYERNEEVVCLLSGVCGTKLLSVDYLLGYSDEPFLADNPNQENFSVTKLLGSTEKYKPKVKPKSTVLISDGNSSNRSSPGILQKIELKSAKMIGLKELLCSEKINTSAIQLQLTAQSQTESKKTLSFDESARPKRSRRE